MQCLCYSTCLWLLVFKRVYLSKVVAALLEPVPLHLAKVYNRSRVTSCTMIVLARWQLAARHWTSDTQYLVRSTAALGMRGLVKLTNEMPAAVAARRGLVAAVTMGSFRW